MSWYKDRDFPEIKASNADVVAVIKDPKQLERVIRDYNELHAQLAQVTAERDKLIQMYSRAENAYHKIAIERDENKTEFHKEENAHIVTRRERDKLVTLLQVLPGESIVERAASLLAGLAQVTAERDDWKWEYDNVCKFANSYEEKLVYAQASNALLRIVLERIKGHSICCFPNDEHGVREALSSDSGELLAALRGAMDALQLGGRELTDAKSGFVCETRERMDVAHAVLEKAMGEG